MIILAASASAIAFLIIPFFLLPDGSFDILRDRPTHPFSFTNIHKSATLVCLELGLITQICIVIISEYFTSHAF